VPTFAESMRDSHRLSLPRGAGHAL
jgi:hypothetical protein